MSVDLDFGPVERALVLRKLDAFEMLSPPQLALIAEQLRARHHRPGAVLFSPGVPLDALAFVMHGSIAVSHATPELTRLGPRQVLGDVASLLSDTPAPHAIAEQSSLTLELRRAELEDVFDDEFAVFVAVLRSLAAALLGAGVIALTAGARTGRPLGIAPRPLGLVERVVLLRRTRYFGETEIGPLAALAEQASELGLPAGSALWQAGDRADDFVIIASGTVAAHTPAGATRLFGPGSTLGAVESLALASRTHSVVTREPVRGLRIAVADALDLLEDHMVAGMSLLGVLARAVKRRA